MNTYWALIKTDLKLAFRQNTVIFFSYIFPLVFLVAFAELMQANQGRTISYVVSMVLVLGILGNGLHGAGLRTVQDRERDIFRRMKTVPITPMPLLMASVVTGWVVYLPAVVLILGVANVFYGMDLPGRPVSLLILVSLGVIAFRAIGLIVASVVNTTQEGSIITQLLFLVMLLLSGATFPMAMLPDFAQMIAQFIPASYLVTGFQAVFLRNETIFASWQSIMALLGTFFLCMFLASKLFRWEKEERIPTKNKAWVAFTVIPFLVLGGIEVNSRNQIRKAELLWRDLQRGETTLITDAQIFTGDGEVIARGGILVRGGKIAEIYRGDAPSAESLEADVIDGSGKTVMPGLIDPLVHLVFPGGIPGNDAQFIPENYAKRALAGYLYSGVTAVSSATDPLDIALRLREQMESGARLGAEYFATGPLFTTEGGWGTHYLSTLPKNLQAVAEEQLIRRPNTSEQATSQATKLFDREVSGLNAVLVHGQAPYLYEGLDVSSLRALGDAARERSLPLVVMTGSSAEVFQAVEAGATIIMHGAYRDLLPDETIALLAERNVAYAPTLSLWDTAARILARDPNLFNDLLIAEVGPMPLLEATALSVNAGSFDKWARWLGDPVQNFLIARENAARCHAAGVPLLTATASGNPGLPHGPVIHREMQLLASAGIEPNAILRAATSNAARSLNLQGRMGRIAAGFEANLLIVNGSPLEQIESTTHISRVLYRGERIQRFELFEQD